MTSTTDGPVVVVSRRIGAPAGDIFRTLADPGRHVDLDGSGMLRGCVRGSPLSCVGDVFVMRMYNERHGDYEMDNHVVAYERDRRIGWEPRPGRGHPDAAASGAAWRHRWIFDLLPDGAGATVVTETFDGSRMPEDKRAEVADGRAWWQANMASTLERLAELWSVRCGRLPQRPPGRGA
jgi:hypothetical protein